MDRNLLLQVRWMYDTKSPPARVAWIETCFSQTGNIRRLVATREGGVDRNSSDSDFRASVTGSPPARVAWIETPLSVIITSFLLSPPARVAWIETLKNRRQTKPKMVATREGGVDRNTTLLCISRFNCGVATREGGVDRNERQPKIQHDKINVATREGGVDRNAVLNQQAAAIVSRHPRGWRG